MFKLHPPSGHRNAATEAATEAESERAQTGPTRHTMAERRTALIESQTKKKEPERGQYQKARNDRERRMALIESQIKKKEQEREQCQKARDDLECHVRAGILALAHKPEHDYTLATETWSRNWAVSQIGQMLDLSEFCDQASEDLSMYIESLMEDFAECSWSDSEED